MLGALLAGPLPVLADGPVAPEKPFKPKLPAWDDKHGTRVPALMLWDQYSTYRNNHIERYVITQPPAAGVRAYGEFEPAKHMLLEWIPGYYDDLFVQMILPTYQNTTVVLFHDGTQDKNGIISRLQNAGVPSSAINNPDRFVFVNAPVDSIWTRDCGPVPAVDASGKSLMIDFQYYWERVYDDGIPYYAGQSLGATVYRPSMKFEGGNFMANGKGLCMATEGAVWNNLPAEKKTTEKIFHDYLGCEKTVFLKPLAGEGTTHIDMYSKIMDETTVIVGEYDYGEDCANATILDENAALLENTTTVDGKPLRVLRIPMPDNSDGVWRTYTNSLLVNNVALVPVYANDRTHEARALAVYRTALPGWTIVPIDSDDIIPDGGAMHCITMTTPAAAFTPVGQPSNLCGNTYTCSASGCGSITAGGYCDGNAAIWCEGGVAQFYDCATPCSLVYGGYPCEQECGLSGGNADCTTKFSCQCPDECASGETGCDASATQSWKCQFDSADQCWRRSFLDCNGGVCSGGQCGGCIPDCAGKECGPDGCGGLCGQCLPDEVCEADQLCHQKPPVDGGTPDAGADTGYSDSGSDASDGSHPSDAGKADAGADGGPVTGDGGTDAGKADAGADGGPVTGDGGADAGKTDAGKKDAGPSDAGRPDAGSDASDRSDASSDSGADGGSATGGRDGGEPEEDSGEAEALADEAAAAGCSCATVAF
jgi:agmatine/peptidylarginine deiminase